MTLESKLTKSSSTQEWSLLSFGLLIEYKPKLIKHTCVHIHLLSSATRPVTLGAHQGLVLIRTVDCHIFVQTMPIKRVHSTTQLDPLSKAHVLVQSLTPFHWLYGTEFSSECCCSVVRVRGGLLQKRNRMMVASFPMTYPDAPPIPISVTTVLH